MYAKNFYRFTRIRRRTNKKQLKACTEKYPLFSPEEEEEEKRGKDMIGGNFQLVLHEEEDTMTLRDYRWFYKKNKTERV